jgi:hypothetical protein
MSSVGKSVSAMGSKISNIGASVAQSLKGNIKGETFPLWALIVIAAAIITCFILWLKYRGTYENAGNIADIAASRYKDANDIIGKEVNRYGLEKYLDPCKNASGKEAETCKKDDLANKPTETDIVLSNFHFATANLTGCFFPTKVGSSANPSDLEYVFSKEAVQFACRGGARAFVLEIWPSMDAVGGFRPVLQVVEEGSSWRRISINSMELEIAIRTIVEEIYTARIGSGDRTTEKDITVLYLRFRGVPRVETYNTVSGILSRTILPYALDPSFSSCRAQERLVRTSIRELQGKIIVLANKSKQELQSDAYTLLPFVNMCAANPSGDTPAMKIEYTPDELTNMTDGDRKTKIRFIQSMITFIIPKDGDTVTNKWDWRTAYNVGIHCIPMNFFERANSAEYFQLFSRYSYSWKRANRLPLTVSTEAAQAADPGTGDGKLNVTTQLTGIAQK